MNVKYIQLYKGEYIKSSNNNKFIKSKPKIIVFDLDETIGSFYDLELLWRGLHIYKNKNENNYTFDNTQENFNKILDLYPEFLRYGILNILDFLKFKKQTDEYIKIFIYTNNKLPKIWANMIIKYLEYKQNCPLLFDKIISAFKINKIIIEPNRTTNDKTYSDFIRCTLLPKNIELCFIDNDYFEKMDNGKVYYIQPKSYFHKIITSEIINRFLLSNIIDFELIEKENNNNTHISKQKCNDFLYSWFIQNNSFVKISKNKSEIEIDTIVSQKMMYYIQEFFYLTIKHKKKNTKKIKLNNIGRFTRKIHRNT
jgi:hypothetical protein